MHLKDEQTDRQTDGRTDGQTDRRTDAQTGYSAAGTAPLRELHASKQVNRRANTLSMHARAADTSKKKKKSIFTQMNDWRRGQTRALYVPSESCCVGWGRPYPMIL
jgi:hypothetical protein